MGRQTDVLALKGKLEENEKTEETMQNFFLCFQTKLCFSEKYEAPREDEVSFWV